MRKDLLIWFAVAAATLSTVQAEAALGPARVAFDASDVEIQSVRSFEKPTLRDCSTLKAVGEPALPIKVLRFVVPSDMAVEDVVASIVDEQELPGTYRIMPAQPEVPIGETAPWAEPDPAIYERDALYPAKRVEYLGDGYLGGYRIASFAVYPMTYAPKSGRLMLATDISVEFSLKRAADRSLPRMRMTARSDRLYQTVVKSLVSNPEDVVIMGGGAQEIVEGPGPDGFLPRHTPSLEGSPVEYVVITNEELASYFDDLVEWKIRKGIPAVLKTVSWIEANYPGGVDTAERIRMFIQDAYSSWGTTYVLLGGDTGVVPVRYARTIYYGGEDIPTDAYYAGLEGNWNLDGDSVFAEAYKDSTARGDSADLYVDVFVGRAPVSNITEAEAALDKWEAYEKTPAPYFTDRNLYLAEVLFPYDWESGPYSLDGATDIVEPVLPTVPAWIRNVKMYANQEEYPYPASYPLNAVDAVDSLNMGYNIVSHVGHANRDLIRVNKNNYITMITMSGLTNGASKSSFMWMLNCNGVAIDYDCIAERGVINPVGGMTSVFGPTRYCFPTTAREYYWDWFEILYNDEIRELGVVCALSKLAFIGSSQHDSTHRWTQLSLVLLGDPEQRLWTARPTSLLAAHPGTLQVGDGGMTVTVTDPSPVEGARVCVYGEAGAVYDYDLTGPTGEVVLNFTPRTTGTLYVTVTADDHSPYESTVTVNDADDAYVYLASWSVDDDNSGLSSGNTNGLVEPSETIEFGIGATNGGVSQADTVTATLSSSDGCVSIEDSVAVLGDIGAGMTSNQNEAFRFTVSDTCENDHDVVFMIEFAEPSRLVWSESFICRVHRPNLEQVYLSIDDAAGNGNGVPEVGETVNVVFDVLNDGNGDADAITGVLRYASSEVTIIDSTDTWGDILAGSFESGATGFQFSVTAPIAAHFTLELSDTYGKTWSSMVDFVAPAATDSLWGRVKSTTIQLSWNPVTDADLRGYDIYRAEDALGPYVRANDAVIERTSYFADSGLDENTLYFFCIASIDSSGNASANSETLQISTNPPSQSGWPHETQSGMYASPVVADLDGDGSLEVVVAAECIYAWHNDGTEVLDGDGDPRTNGIFADDGTGGYRASPAIGEIDGDTGVEIVCPAWSNVGTPEDPVYEVFVWNGEDGSVVSGWPTTTTGYCWASPVLADLDHDGRSEVLVPDSDGYLYCWRYNGSEYIDGDDDPLTVGVFAYLGNPWVYGSPAVADIDHDGELEIVQPGTPDSVFCFNHDGSRVTGWPFYTIGKSISSSAVGDVDNDGDVEVAVTSHDNKAWLLESDATVMSGWSQNIKVGGDFPPSPVFANITGDEYLEWVQIGSNGKVQIWNYLGGTVAGWPQYLPTDSHSSPAVGDIDGDPGMELVVGCNDGRVYAYDTDGSVLDGWPILTGAGIYSSPAIIDLDQDGDNEVILGGMDANVYIWDCAGNYDDGEGVEWGHFLHDQWRTQHYDFDMPVGVPDGGGDSDLVSEPLLKQNHPNPFNPVTVISFSVPGEGTGLAPVTLEIYGVSGSLVRVLVDKGLGGGPHSVVWDGRDDRGRRVASGIYFYRLSVGKETAERKMALIK